MSFLSRITGKAQGVVLPKAQKLPNRFLGDGGFIACGAAKHAPRTNSSEEIIASLKILAELETNKIDSNTKILIKEAKDILSVDLEKEAKNTNSDLLTTAQNIINKEIGALKIRKYSDQVRVRAEQLDYVNQLLRNVRAAKLKSAEIQEFIKNAGEMPLRHLSLAHDVVDLSNMSAFVNREIFPTVDFNTIGKINSTGKETTLMGYVLNLLPGLSKANPKAVDLAETVASNCDDTATRFFLSRFVDNFPIIGTEKQAEAAEGLVEPIAKSVLKGMPSMDLGPSSKEHTFFNQLRVLCGLDSKPENLKLLKQTIDATDDIAPHVDANINLDDIRVGDTQRIAENMEFLPKILENAEAQGVKSLDVSGFLTKNVNLN